MKDILDDAQAIRRIDTSDMFGLLKTFPEQFKDAAVLAHAIELPNFRRARNIVFSGLGGSAIGADLLRSYAAGEVKLPIYINRHYTLPKFVDENTLFVASSYSGDTEETLESFEIARHTGAKIIAISSDGQLKKLAKRYRVPFIEIPRGYPPRCALGYSFVMPLSILIKLGFISGKEAQIKEAISVMKDTGVDGLAGAKALARRLHDRFCVIYAGTEHFDAVATRWRGQLAENSKVLASSHVFPEMNHNEIVGWAHPEELLRNFTAIFLRDAGDHPRVQRRMDITRTIITRSGSKVIEVHSKGEGLLARIFSLICLGDFASFYLAILNRVDPTPVESVMYLKRMLKR